MHTMMTKGAASAKTAAPERQAQPTRAINTPLPQRQSELLPRGRGQRTEDGGQKELLLTTFERADLLLCEHKIEKGLATFWEVGTAIAQIRAARLYRETHATFEDYLQHKWGLGGRRARQLCAAAGVNDSLNDGTIDIKLLPNTESQARVLAGVPVEQRKEVYAELLKIPREGPPTAREISDALKEDAETRRRGERESVRAWERAKSGARNSEALKADVTKAEVSKRQKAESGEKITYASARASATIRVKQVSAHGWVSSWEHTHRSGSCESCGGDFDGAQVMDGRDKAVALAAERGIRLNKSITKEMNSCVNKRQIEAANKVISWAQGLIDDCGRPEDVKLEKAKAADPEPEPEPVPVPEATIPKRLRNILRVARYAVSNLEQLDHLIDPTDTPGHKLCEGALSQLKDLVKLFRRKAGQ